MANPDSGNQKSDLGNRPPAFKRSAAAAQPKVMEKPAFPSADLPGKAQPRDRSAGVKRVKTHPKSLGL